MKTSLRLLLGLSRVTGVLALAATVGGCVAAKHYDEARSVAETEMAGHARTRARLESALARLERLDKDLASKEAALSRTKEELDAGESIAAASKLEATVALTEKRAAGELVDQLRAELARTGDHLRTFAFEKHNVEQALALAEERIQNADSASKGLVELVAMARDLAVGLGDPLAAGSLSLGARDGTIVVGIPADELFVPEQTALGPQTLELISTLASVAAAHPSYRMELREPQSGTVGELRTQTLLQALVDKGAPLERVAAATEPGAPALVADAAAPAPAAPDVNVEGRGDAPSEASATVPAPPAPERYEIAFLRL
jgi:hypothetical protein